MVSGNVGCVSRNNCVIGSCMQAIDTGFLIEITIISLLAHELVRVEENCTSVS